MAVEPYIGEILMFSGNFAPRGWAFCNGQLISIQQNPALFSILGNTYGGDGRTTFALPDLRGRFPMQQGRGAGLSSRLLGQAGGSETTKLSIMNLPNHTHTVYASSKRADTDKPGPSAMLATPNHDIYNNGNRAGDKIDLGSSTPETQQPVNNMPPYIAINFIIALRGYYPPRS